MIFALYIRIDLGTIVERTFSSGIIALINCLIVKLFPDVKAKVQPLHNPDFYDLKSAFVSLADLAP